MTHFKPPWGPTAKILGLNCICWTMFDFLKKCGTLLCSSKSCSVRYRYKMKCLAEFYVLWSCQTDFPKLDKLFESFPITICLMVKIWAKRLQLIFVKASVRCRRKFISVLKSGKKTTKSYFKKKSDNRLFRSKISIRLNFDYFANIFL